MTKTEDVTADDLNNNKPVYTIGNIVLNSELNDSDKRDSEPLGSIRTPNLGLVESEIYQIDPIKDFYESQMEKISTKCNHFDQNKNSPVNAEEIIRENTPFFHNIADELNTVQIYESNSNKKIALGNSGFPILTKNINLISNVDDMMELPQEQLKIPSMMDKEKTPEQSPNRSRSFLSQNFTPNTVHTPERKKHLIEQLTPEKLQTHRVRESRNSINKNDSNKICFEGDMSA